MLMSAACLFAQQPERLTLAVSDLQAQGVKESGAAVVSEQLRVELSKNTRIRLVERGQMQEILKEQGFQQTGCTNDACAVEVGQLLGVKNMVVGSVGAAGSFTILTVRLIDVASGAVLVNESVRTKGGIDQVLISGIREGTARLNRQMFPDTPAAQARSRKGGAGKYLLWGGAGAVLVGGGVAALVLFPRTEEPSKTENYTEIYLP